MKLEINNFDFRYWDLFLDMIQARCIKVHPIIDRDLFEWQYRSIGLLSSCNKFKLLFSNALQTGLRNFCSVVGLNSNWSLNRGQSRTWLHFSAFEPCESPDQCKVVDKVRRQYSAV